MAKDFPVGKAQQVILNALGLRASGYADAERQFSELGITVIAQRIGKTSMPVVRVHAGVVGGFNAEGEGGTWIEEAKVNLSAIAEWIER